MVELADTFGLSPNAGNSVSVQIRFGAPRPIRQSMIKLGCESWYQNPVRSPENLGVVQLAERQFWELEAVSSNLTAQTTRRVRQAVKSRDFQSRVTGSNPVPVTIRHTPEIKIIFYHTFHGKKCSIHGHLQEVKMNNFHKTPAGGL